MKVLIICNSASGLEVFRGMLIRKLIKEGNILTSIIPVSIEQKEQDAEKIIKEWGCRLIHIPMERRGMNPIKDINLLKRYYRILKKERSDLVLTYTIKPNIYGGFSCRILKIPYAVNVTGLGTAFQGDGMLKYLVTIMYKIALKKVKVVFFENTEDENKMVNAKIITKEKTCVLAGAGVDLEYFVYSDYPKDTKEIRFLFIGRVMKEKGIDELFCAMQRLNENNYRCSLDILGDFEENYLDKIKKYEDEGWLHYRGYQNDVRPFIEKAHCFVLPSWHEGMANTNLENAAMGRPVITSNIHGCLEAVEDGITGFLCEKHNANELYYAMEKMCKLSNEERQAMGIAGRRRMKKYFDKKDVVEKTINKLRGKQ